MLQTTMQATANVFDAKGLPLIGRAIVWASSNTTSATVDSAGVVKGVSRGVSYIKATVEGRSDSAPVTILGVASVVVQPDTASMPPNDTLTLSGAVVADPGIQSTLLWSSSAPAIATISTTGLITGRLPGRAVIRAQATADLATYDSVRVTARGLGRTFGLVPTCGFRLPLGSVVQTARIFYIPTPNQPGRPLVIQANAPGYAVRLVVASGLSGQTLLASATATPPVRTRC